MYVLAYSKNGRDYALKSEMYLFTIIVPFPSLTLIHGGKHALKNLYAL